MLYFGIFGDQHPRICQIAKFREIMKCLNVGIKMPKFFTINALFRYFWARILKTLVTFEISILEFVKK